ncbi:hypothetical protein [Campylobacter sp. RM16192]|uniref:hypothetical protein n=1 Tax=Campylobacter sp. RM16192 TaxID=1660080 RepID=UPI001451E36C|nr:hypothetical protein [Campylobacter sp. RM16192]QCD52833.1 hypothetical protein CDOMC_1226 [Campylobacter sp. RM16192]
MNSLFSQPTQVEILNFQTFTNEYVANRYGISEATIRSHKKLHADELVENIHFITETNKFGTNEIKWTLRGIIKLGMFIRSPQAKSFRLWAEQELEKSILAELKTAKETKERNLRLIDENNALNLELINKTKRHKREIATYKGKLTMAKNQLRAYEFKATTFPETEKLQQELKNAKASAHNYKLDMEFYMRKYRELKKQNEELESKSVKALDAIQRQMEHIFTAIGAVKSFINDGDEYFMKEKGLLKG